MSGFKRLRSTSPLLAVAGLCLAGVVWGADFQVIVACPDWAPETRGQVDARIRASLLIERRAVQLVTVLCDTDGTSVAVTNASAQLVRPVIRHAGSLEDDVIEAVEKALLELQTPPAVPIEPTPSAAPLVQSPPAREALPPEDTPVPVALNPTPQPSAAPAHRGRARPRASAEAQARALGERWSNNWAWGGELGLSFGTPRLQYGVLAAHRSATGEPASFDLSESSAAARVQLTLPELMGLRAGLALGASLLMIHPSSGVVAESDTQLTVAFAELSVSRPFWIGNVGVAPALGARVFAGAGRVRVNHEAVLTLPVVSPQVSLAGIWRLPLP